MSPNEPDPKKHKLSPIRFLYRLPDEGSPCADDPREIYTRSMITRWIMYGFFVFLFLTAIITLCEYIWQEGFKELQIAQALDYIRYTAVFAFILSALLLIFRYVAYGNARNMKLKLGSPYRDVADAVMESRKSKQLMAFDPSIERLHKAAETSYWMSITNLFIGFLVTVVGFGLLVYFVVVMNDKSNQPGNALISYFIPRLSLTLLVELFAFFFLKLYERNLKEVKFYQNEITSLEYKAIAASIVEETDKAGAYARIVDHLLQQSGKNLTENRADKEDPETREDPQAIALNILNSIVETVKGLQSGK